LLDRPESEEFAVIELIIGILEVFADSFLVLLNQRWKETEEVSLYPYGIISIKWRL
tara:strand:- start:1068 stop:1235 length:168 start_codon:yes stop_codon:yes gene_type:complete